MSDRLFISRLFLWIGGVLIVAGLALWLLLPITGVFPPYVVTGLLAVAYGVYCGYFWRSASPKRAGKS
jgi:hypothetical protein